MTPAEEVESVVKQIRPLLAGHPAELQGAILADLLATWLAGHIVLNNKTATQKMRTGLLTLHLSSVRDLIPLCEAEILEKKGQRHDTH